MNNNECDSKKVTTKIKKNETVERTSNLSLMSIK